MREPYKRCAPLVTYLYDHPALNLKLAQPHAGRCAAEQKDPYSHLGTKVGGVEARVEFKTHAPAAQRATLIPLDGRVPHRGRTRAPSETLEVHALDCGGSRLLTHQLVESTLR